LREKAVSAGHSRFIANLRGYTQDASRLYFLLELATGGDLRAALRTHADGSAGGAASRGLPLEAVRRFGAELTLALEHIHRHCVVYRDLKPENALLTADGHVKLTDFGLARQLPPGLRTFTHAGTDEYMPPELLQNLGTGSGMDWW
jgi:serine/threonine protein kinase